MSDLDFILDYLMHQWLPVEVREAYKRLLKAQNEKGPYCGEGEVLPPVEPPNVKVPF